MARINNILSVLVIIRARGSTIICKKRSREGVVHYYNANWRLRKSHNCTSKLVMEKKLSWINVAGHKSYTANAERIDIKLSNGVT